MSANKIILFLVCIAIYGCSAKKDYTYREFTDFEERTSLQCVKMKVPPVLLYPRALFLLDDKLIVFNEKTDTLFQMFSIPELQYLNQFGTKGEGPEEFNLPSTQAINSNKNSFTLIDCNQLKTIKIEGTKGCVTSIKMPHDFQYFNGLIQLKDSLFCCSAGFESEHELMFLYPNGKYKEYGEFPEEVGNRFPTPLMRNQAYNSLRVAHPDGKRFALFYQHIRRFRIYTSEEKLETDNVLNISPGEIKPDTDSEKCYIHPIALYATNRYIYSLNLDMTPQEIGERKKMPNIQVFNWKGKPIKQYQLDCYISSFTVDEPNGMIYGTFVEDENHIYKFKL